MSTKIPRYFFSSAFFSMKKSKKHFFFKNQKHHPWRKTYPKQSVWLLLSREKSWFYRFLDRGANYFFYKSSFWRISCKHMTKSSELLVDMWCGAWKHCSQDCTRIEPLPQNCTRFTNNAVHRAIRGIASFTRPHSVVDSQILLCVSTDRITRSRSLRGCQQTESYPHQPRSFPWEFRCSACGGSGRG